MTVHAYGATGLYGGGNYDLDYKNGAILNAGDVGFVASSGGVYFYTLKEISDAENPPAIIAPDTNSTHKRWVETGIRRLPLDVDQAKGKKISTDKISAIDGDGLRLVNDGDVGLWIKDDGTLEVPGQLISQATAPTAPFSIVSSVKVSNLNVDRLDDKHLITGRESLSNAVSGATVTISGPTTTTYAIQVTLENTTDANPSQYAMTVVDKQTTSFSVEFSGDTDSANYVLNWIIFY